MEVFYGLDEMRLAEDEVGGVRLDDGDNGEFHAPPPAGGAPNKWYAPGRRLQAPTGDSGARGQRESMTFEPVVELNSNVPCQRLISGKALGQIRPKPRSRAPVALPPWWQCRPRSVPASGGHACAAREAC